MVDVFGTGKCIRDEDGAMCMELYHAIEVQIIKLAVCNIESVGLSGREVLTGSIVWLCERYEETKERKYLEKAVWHMYAYLELWHPYEMAQREFDTVLDYLGVRAEEIFSPIKYNYKKIPLNNTNIRNLLGRWNPRLHCMKIDDVVKDIKDKVANKKEGVYLYHSGKIIKQEKKEVLWEQTYRLYVRSDEAVFHDLNKNKYYTLVQRK